MKKGIFPLWFTAILGFLFLVVGAYLAIAMTAIPIAFWIGIVLIIIGLAMIGIAAVLA